MLLDNGWYAMLRRPGVELVTEAVTEVTETGLVDSAVGPHDFDVVIMATGFHTDRYLYPMDITGRSGPDHPGGVGRARRHGLPRHHGSRLPKLVHHDRAEHRARPRRSFITILEYQIRYVMDLISTMVEQGLGTVEVRGDVHDEYNRAVDEAHARMVWTHPAMDNWYATPTAGWSPSSPGASASTGR
jgi:4-hydroxyacetophenone monooxygenase